MVKNFKRRETQLEPLEAIKRLLVLQLLAYGVSIKAIAKVLEIDASTVRHLISLKEIRTPNKNNE